MAAPEKARKALPKGQEEERKGKLQAACDYFKKAVGIYPRYALAWLELGRFQARQSSFTDAQESFRQAVTSDSNLAAGYVDFAIVSAQQKNWQAMAEMTDTLVQRFPDSSPVYWFLNSAAYYHLGRMKEAQTSITRALRLDPRHQLPQLEYLYGLILDQTKTNRRRSKSAPTLIRRTHHLRAKILATFQQRRRWWTPGSTDGGA